MDRSDGGDSGGDSGGDGAGNYPHLYMASAKRECINRKNF